MAGADNDEADHGRSEGRWRGVPGVYQVRALVRAQRCRQESRRAWAAGVIPTSPFSKMEPFQNRWAILRRRTTPSPISPMPTRNRPTGAGSGTTVGSANPWMTSLPQYMVLSKLKLRKPLPTVQVPVLPVAVALDLFTATA